jgi:hypothetical protein
MKLQFYLASAGAGLLSSFLDLVKDPTNGTIARTGSAIHQGLFPNPLVSQNLIAILAIVLVSIFACWVFEVTSRLDGFLRGCTILAAFSVGSPSPIINSQIDQINAPKSQSALPFTASAFAQTAYPDAPTVGSAYIILTHLKTTLAPPDSIVTVNLFYGERVSVFRISRYRIEITQPYGKYTVHVDTPGYTSITFTLTITQPIEAYDVTAPESSIPIAFQKLTTATQAVLRPDESEQSKQLGRAKAVSHDFAGAITDYQHSLALDPTDDETITFFGYALFRTGNNGRAESVLLEVLTRHPENNFARINLIKAQCAGGKLEDAKHNFDLGLRQLKDFWSNDGEFVRVCKSLIAP